MLCAGRGDVYHNKSIKLLMKEEKDKKYSTCSDLKAVFTERFIELY